MAKRDEEAAPASDTPLLIEGPKTEASDGLILDLEPLRVIAEDQAAPETEAAEATAQETAPPPKSRWTLPGYAPLAAGIAFAIAIGAIAGAAGTVSLMHDDGSAALAASTENRELRENLSALSGEIAALKSGMAAAQKNATAQFGKLAERLDRAEKAQAEPAAKLTRIQESLDRLDRRQQQAAVAPAAAPHAPDVTGSIAAKEESRPPLAEGWRLRDFYAGRAIVQSRNGTLFEVGPGSNLPGLGRVQSVKRENNQVVVVAQSGTIAGTPATRRPPVLLPYRY